MKLLTVALEVIYALSVVAFVYHWIMDDVNGMLSDANYAKTFVVGGAGVVAGKAAFANGFKYAAFCAGTGSVVTLMFYDISVSKLTGEIYGTMRHVKKGDYLKAVRNVAVAFTEGVMSYEKTKSEETEGKTKTYDDKPFIRSVKSYEQTKSENTEGKTKIDDNKPVIRGVKSYEQTKSENTEGKTKIDDNNPVIRGIKSNEQTKSEKTEERLR